MDAKREGEQGVTQQQQQQLQIAPCTAILNRNHMAIDQLVVLMIMLMLMLMLLLLCFYSASTSVASTVLLLCFYSASTLLLLLTLSCNSSSGLEPNAPPLSTTSYTFLHFYKQDVETYTL